MKNIFSKIIGLGAVGCSALLLRSFYERKKFKVVHYNISTDKIKGGKKIKLSREEMMAQLLADKAGQTAEQKQPAPEWR